MLRSTASKIAWVGRTASMVFGLALVLALILGVATTALSATGGNFILGKPNSAGSQTSLVGTVTKAAQSALVVVNKGTGSALDVRVTNTNSPPMKVNSSAKVNKLNADLLDDQEASAFASDSEVMDIVKANDGANSGLDADKLDELDSTALLPGGDLPRGRTVRGSYHIRGYVPPESYAMDSSAISFGYRLASSPTVRIIKAGTTAPAECPGTASSPEAAPGNLCVYESDAFNLASGSYYGTSPQSYSVTRDGTSLVAHSAKGGTGVTFPYYTYGTWAVTGS